eukprot:8891893-Ditylum_brightwellii.AAC.2
MDKGKRIIGEVKLLHEFEDVFHFDIECGCKQGLGGLKYSLLFVDRAARYDLIYPLQNLTTDLIKAIKQLITDLGFAPKRIVVDFDMKLIGCAFKEFFTKKGTIVEGAPPHHQ